MAEAHEQLRDGCYNLGIMGEQLRLAWPRLVPLNRRIPFLGAMVVFILVGIIGLPAVLWLPEWLVNQYGHGGPDKLTRMEYTAEVDAYRKTIAQILAGIGGLYALFLLFKHTHAAMATLDISRESQITDRFTKAIEQLGACDKEGRKLLEVRFGGIYALERIARDSPRDHWPIMEILTAYVRQNAAYKVPSAAENPVAKTELEKDIQAILTVIGRRTQDAEEAHTEEKLDLSGTDLRYARLSYARLEGINFSGALLDFSDLSHAQLIGAQFWNSHVERTKFDGANLERARFDGAHLEHARFFEAHLERALLMNANLKFTLFANAHATGAKFAGADLRQSVFDRADARWADFDGARLEEAFLGNACMHGAILVRARLDKAYLVGAQLYGANMAAAHSDGANFAGVDLSGVIGLTRDVLGDDESTKLPDGFPCLSRDMVIAPIKAQTDNSEGAAPTPANPGGDDVRAASSEV